MIKERMWLSVDDVARFAGVPAPAVEEVVKRGRLPVVRVARGGLTWLAHRRDVEQWMARVSIASPKGGDVTWPMSASSEVGVPALRQHRLR